MFAHEESPVCKFGGGCERIMCMFQHEDNDESGDEDNDDDDEDDDDDESNNVITIADIETSLNKVEEAMEKVNELLKKQRLKCDVCDFQAKNVNGLNMHKKSKHTDNSK